MKMKSLMIKLVPAILILMFIVDVGSGSAAVYTVDVTPGVASASFGEQVQFDAEVYDSEGNPVDAPIYWEVVPRRIGEVSSDGLFTAGDKAGRGLVRAMVTLEDGQGVGHALVRVGIEPWERLVVRIDPRRGVTDPGGTIQYEVTVVDPVENEEVDATVEWDVLPEGLGTIDQSGLLTAADRRGVGRVIARATYGEKEGLGEAIAVVGPVLGPGVKVKVRPPKALVHFGEEFQFDVVVLDRQGQEIPDAEVEWSVVPEELGMITPDGLFTAGEVALMGRVVATVATEDGVERGFSQVVVAGTERSVVVRLRPRALVVNPGEVVQMEAEVIGPDGEPIDVPVEWLVRPAEIGEISPDGYFTAGDLPEGTDVAAGEIVASVDTDQGTAADVSRVTLTSRVAGPKLVVRPRFVRVLPGDEVQFSAEVIAEDYDGAPITWSVRPPEIGTITADGLFTASEFLAEAAGSSEFGRRVGVVIAETELSDGTPIAGRAHVVVGGHGPDVKVIVRPRIAMVPLCGGRFFTATILGPAGNEIEANVPVRWSVEPPRLGTVTPVGGQAAYFSAYCPENDLATSPGPSRGKVIAEIRMGRNKVYRGAADVVIIEPEKALRVSIHPKNVTVAAGGEVQFEITVHDRHGTEVTDYEAEWFVKPPELGRMIGPEGLFEAAMRPEHGIVFVKVVDSLGRLGGNFANVRVAGGQLH
jgi:hypothetical protein